MADTSGRDYHYVYNTEECRKWPVPECKNVTQVIQRVPVISTLNCEKVESKRCDIITASHSYETATHSDYHSEATSDYSDANNDITTSLLGVLFPHNPSETDSSGQHYNLELLENNFHIEGEETLG